MEDIADRPHYADPVMVDERHSVFLPASRARRVIAVLADTVVVLLVAVLALRWGAMGCAAMVIATLAVMVLLQALTGATPGDAIAGVRLRRVSRQGARPGWAAIYRAALLVLAAAATAGIAPLVFFLRIVLKRGERSWFDRLAGTVMLSSAAASGTACSLVCDGVLIALTGPTVVGRQPSQIASHPDARLVPILVDDSSVSKTHALLVPTLHGVMITDLDSTNGTHVEDEWGVHRIDPGQPLFVRHGRHAYFGDGVCVIGS